MKTYIKLMRPHHYIKNLLVFVPLVCSGKLFTSEKLLICFFGFCAFCMASSAIYIINDIKDVNKDRCHPVKCNRPIASGQVSVNKALLMSGFLFLISIVCNLFCFHPVSTFLLGAYLVLNLAYSIGLKNIPLLDITILVSGFFFRILYGAYITNIVISNWLYLTIIVLAFYFSLGKRRNELRQQYYRETRKVLRAYPLSFLDKSMNMCMTLAFCFYALWCMDEKTTTAYGQNLLFSVVLVLLIGMKYSLNIEGDSDGDPVEVLLHDKVLLILCAVYLATMFWMLYF